MQSNNEPTKDRLSTEWFIGLSAEEKEAHKAYLLNSKPLFDQLKKMLHSRFQAKQRVGMADFDSPSWAFKEAYRHGYLEALEEMAKLLP